MPQKSEVLGWEDYPMVGKVLKMKVASPAVEGEANKAISQLLAQILDIPKSSIQLSWGHKSRTKTFIVPDSARLP